MDSYIHKEIPKRYQEIAEMRELGKTFREIGEAFKISASRSGQIYKKYLALQKYNEAIDNAPWDIHRCLVEARVNSSCDCGLVIRTYNAIVRSGFLIDNAIIVNDYSDEQLLKIRNIGIESLKLLRRAIDIYKVKNNI